MTESTRQGVLLAGLAASAAGMWLALSPRTVRLRIVGSTIASAGIIAAVAMLHESGEGLLSDYSREILFWLFAAGAVISGVFMVTSREPVYAALWFALATLGTCGLFMLLWAPFLAAATIIVYAGAIIVTFLFVIMLAQQQGYSFQDHRGQPPVMAVVASWLLLAALLWSFHQWRLSPAPDDGPALTAEAVANPLSRPADDEAFDTMRAAGRSLFGDYVYAIEIAGTLLLVAAIGAIAIAPRRAEGTI